MRSPEVEFSCAIATRFYFGRGRIEPDLCTAGIPAGVFDFADALCTAGLRPAFLIFVGGAKADERQPRYGTELQGTSDSKRLQVFSTAAD
jgi:hypothetical protein